MTYFPDHLVAGYRDFLEGRYSEERERYHRLAESGQTPQTLVIACCDSRAAPETIFNTGPGEIFTLRNVANLVPPYEPDEHLHAASSAIEFAVQALGVRHIVVLAHGRCGGIQAALNPGGEPLSEGDFIGHWVGLLTPLARSVDPDGTMDPTERATALECHAVGQSIENLRTFPFVDKRERAGELSLHGAWFDISEGRLWVRDPEDGVFAPLDGTA
ncbi:carbonic anhydrase [Pararhizobium mangrovi]|uniref:carbonic anhydrase n=1 Tax=Pararhizobium mangrovi TaxID=2590452 RepID=A0A506TX29_9HYPH|nr:carbonic anhydrase [Pararhizobium mangrovi]TPW26070.1 carbonic anhydrase [Pararhizobium mangrovi]